MPAVRRTGRKTAPPKRYEPEEMPEDDFDDDHGTKDDMTEQDETASETASEDSGTTGSLAGFLTSDDELEPDSDAGDPDWELDSADTGSDAGTGSDAETEEDESDID